MEFYNDSFYDNIDKKYGKFAGVLMSILLDTYEPASIVDAGCGTGLYLEKPLLAGIDCLGIDISPVALARSIIPREKSILADLSWPLDLEHKFDMCLSFEVAEHIAPEYANMYVKNLARLSCNNIIMSAAMPGQTGSDHVNEQPQQYWIDKLDLIGFEYEEKDTLEIRSTINDEMEPGSLVNNFPYLNMMIFTKL